MLRGPQPGTLEGSGSSSLPEAEIDGDPSTVKANVPPEARIAYGLGTHAYAHRVGDYYTTDGEGGPPLHVIHQGRNGRIKVLHVQ